MLKGLKNTITYYHLFFLYINDVMVGTESEIRLFADDCVCYPQIDSIEDTLKHQKNIDQLGKWVRKWGMRFQPVKCNLMQLGSGSKRSMQFTPQKEQSSKIWIILNILV